VEYCHWDSITSSCMDNGGTGAGGSCDTHPDQYSCDSVEYCHWDSITSSCMDNGGSDHSSAPFEPIVFFSFRECEFNRRPETEGDHLAEFLGIASEEYDEVKEGCAIVMAPENLDQLFLRLKLIKSSFDKKHLNDVIDSDARKTYRSSHITKIQHLCTSPDVITDERAAAYLHITRAELAQTWPSRPGYQIYKINVPNLDVFGIDQYERMRVELSVPTDTSPLGTSARAVVHACAKIKP